MIKYKKIFIKICNNRQSVGNTIYKEVKIKEVYSNANTRDQKRSNLFSEFATNK